MRKALPIAAIVIGAALCGACHEASAQDDQSQSAATDVQTEDPAIACVQELAAAEVAFQSKLDARALSEADAEKLNQLLDDADALCSGGDMKQARETLRTVNETVAKAK